LSNLAQRLEITRKSLASRLLHWIERQSRSVEEAGAESGNSGKAVHPEFDEKTRERLRSLGYLSE